MKGWGDTQVTDRAPYPSMVGDDHSPFEYSLAFGGFSVELRLLLEAQAAAPDLIANRDAAVAFNDRLRPLGVDLDRFHKIQELFLPEIPEPPFTLWHALSLRPGAGADFKIYLNPQARGRDRAPALVQEAMARLGFPAGSTFFDTFARRGDELDELAYFSLDLSGGPNARVKVYFRHHGVTALEMEKAFSNVSAHRAGDVEDFCRIIADASGPFVRKAPTSCLSFAGNSMAPVAATFHFPIAHYVDDDALAFRRVTQLLSTHGLDSNAYGRALNAFTPRPLAGQAGVQSYVSYRREPSGMRATVYLSPELFRGGVTATSHTRLKSGEPLAPGSVAWRDGTTGARGDHR
jgi:hypothetical protein